jgi:hypothetical protein
MRTASWVLDAVHNGQPLGAVLGYRLERDLHDSHLSDIVDDIRAVFPARSAPEGEGAREQVVPHDVVDGERAWDAWKDGGINALGAWVGGLAGRQGDLDAVMRRVDIAVEAVADLLVAEGVHQIVSGNSAKAAATLNAVAYGDPPPDDFDVLRSPRNGIVFTNRVVLALQGDTGVAGWDATAPRARMAPLLEAWAERLLGPPAQWTCDVVTGSDDEPEVTSFTLASLPGLCALDVIHEATAVASGAQSPLADRIVAAADRPGGRVGQTTPGGLGWEQLLAVAGALRDLLSASRPLNGQDLLPPDAAQLAEPVPPAEVSALKATLDALVADLKQATADLTAAQAVSGAAAARAALSQLVGFGVAAAAQAASVPDETIIGSNGVALAAASAATRTLEAVNAALGVTEATPNPGITFDKLLAAARALLGPTTTLTPLLAAVPDLAVSPDLSASGPYAAADWLTRTGRVRPAVSALEDVRMFGAALGLADLPLRVTQTPCAPGDAWVGGVLPEIADARNPLRRRKLPGRATTHLVFVSHAGLDPAAPLAGLVLDQFTEVIPAESQTTGIGLHYDAPNARPPQSILLAVHPNPSRADLPWSWPMVESMLRETIAMAQLRTVELEQLAPTAIDEYLPATYARDGMENMTPLHRISSDLFTQFGIEALSVKANLDLMSRG